MLVLNRLCSNLLGTFGVFIYGRRVLCYTLELPWLGNVQNVSCVPLGEYSVARHKSPKFGDTFWLKNVPARSEILIHAGNSLLDTKGCILPGLDVSDTGVSHSRSALGRLFSALPNEFNLIIREA